MDFPKKARVKYVCDIICQGVKMNTSLFLISKILGNPEDPPGSLQSLARLRRPAAPLFQIPLLTEIQRFQGESLLNQWCLSLRHRRGRLSA